MPVPQRSYLLVPSDRVIGVLIIVSRLYATTCAVGMRADMTWVWAHSIVRFVSRRAATRDQQNAFLGELDISPVTVTLD